MISDGRYKCDRGSPVKTVPTKHDGSSSQGYFSLRCFTLEKEKHAQKLVWSPSNLSLAKSESIYIILRNSCRVPYPRCELTFKINLYGNQSYPGRVSLPKLAAVTMKRETFQFLSSTRSGTRHMLALALWMEPLRMADRGVLAEGNKRNTIIQLRWLRKRKILEGCSGRVDTKEGCDGACCFVLPATTKENISDFAGLNERLRTPYIMRECYCISCF